MMSSNDWYPPIQRQCSARAPPGVHGSQVGMYFEFLRFSLMLCLVYTLVWVCMFAA